MKPLSMDLRERILKAALEGSESMPRIGVRFGVHPKTVEKLKYQWLRTGSIEPRTYQAGRKPLLSDAQRRRLDQLVRSDPSLTLEELRCKLRVNCCIATIWNAVRALGHTHKKNNCEPVSSNVLT